MIRARLCAIETAKSHIELAAIYLKQPFTMGRLKATRHVISARELLGTGPRKGPRIEAAYAEVLPLYQDVAMRLLLKLGEELAI